MQATGSHRVAHIPSESSPGLTKSVPMPGILDILEEESPKDDVTPTVMGAVMDAFLLRASARASAMRGELRAAASFRREHSASVAGSLASGSTLLSIGVRRTTMMKNLNRIEIGEFIAERSPREEDERDLSEEVPPLLLISASQFDRSRPW